MLILLVIALGISLGKPQSQPKEFSNGSRLARALVETAKSTGGTVSFDPSEGKFCMVPGTGFADLHATRLFPGFEVGFIESNESEGAWYAILLNAEDKLEIYEVDRQKIEWEIDETVPLSQLLICPKAITIDEIAGLPTITKIVK